MNKIIISLLSFFLFLTIAAPASASFQVPKKNICHPTSSETNPWEAIRVSIFSHLGNGHENDFTYNGPVDEDNKPTSDEWCNNNQEGDVCENIDGKQTETPEGYTNEDGICTEIEKEEPKEEPEATVSATPKIETPTTLPDTGAFLLLLGSLGIITASAGISLYQAKKFFK